MSPPPGFSAVSAALARTGLSVWAVGAIVMAGVAPLTVAAGVLPTALAVTGQTAIPAALAAVALVLAVFAVGYVRMARHLPNRGAFFAYITGGLGKPVGVAAALVAVLAYGCLQVGLFGALGPGAHDFALAHMGIDLPWWLWATSAAVVVAILSLVKVEVRVGVAGLLMAAEVVVILALSATGILHPAAGNAAASTLNPLHINGSGLGALAVIATLAFTGFEGTAVFVEQARHRARTVMAATFGCLLAIAGVYALAAYAMNAHYGVADVVSVAQAQGPGAMFGLGGAGLSLAGQSLYLTSLFAALLAFQDYVNRYVFSMARDNVLPPAFARVNRHDSPYVASTVLSLTGLAVIAVYAVAGWDPLTKLFFWIGTTGGYGILILLALTSVAVVVYFAKNPRGEHVLVRLIAPTVAAVALALMAWAATGNYATLLGVPPGSPEAKLLPAAYLAVAAIGLVLAGVLRSRRPVVYAGIGTGHLAAVPAPVGLAPAGPGPTDQLGGWWR